MKFGLIGAMDEEIILYKNNINSLTESEKAKYFFYEGIFHGKDIVLVKSGAGKVNAAACTQMLIDEFDVSHIIFTGVAGALNPSLNVNDIVISKDSIQHDIDATALGFDRGQIPFENSKIFEADKILKDLAYKIAKEDRLSFIMGRILTGDQFIQNEDKSRSLHDYFKGDCVDMETAAVAHVCEINNVPYVAIRSISDKADHSADINFKEFCEKAAKNSYLLISKLINRF